MLLQLMFCCIFVNNPMPKTARSSNWRQAGLGAVCVSIAITCIARSAADNVWALRWLAAPEARSALFGALAVSFTLLASQGWWNCRTLSVAFLSLFGVATVSIGGLICDSACAANCADRGAGTFLSLFGGMILVVAVLESESSTSRRRQVNPSRQRRRR
jgi:hypothetical protein